MPFRATAGPGRTLRAKVASGMIDALAGGCAGAGPSCGFSGWKTTSGAVISATPETRKRFGRRPGTRGQRDGVADPGLQRGGELLVEHDRARRQRALQQAEGVDVGQVSRGHREDLAAAGARRAARAAVSAAGERGGGGGGRLLDPGLGGHGGGDSAGLGKGSDGSLPVERDAADGGPRHRPQRVADEQEHRSQQRHRGRQNSDPHRCPARRAQQPGGGEAQGGAHVKRSCPVMRPSANPTTRSKRAATSASWVAVTCAKPNSLVQRVDQVEHALAGVGVEVAGRLVAEQQPRALGQRAGDRDALGLAARQLRRERVELRGQPDQGSAAALDPAPPRRPRQSGGSSSDGRGRARARRRRRSRTR